MVAENPTRSSIGVKSTRNRVFGAEPSSRFGPPMSSTAEHRPEQTIAEQQDIRRASRIFHILTYQSVSRILILRDFI